MLGVDISSVILSDAQAKLPSAKFMKADIFQVEFPGQSFDAIAIFFSLAAGSSQYLIRRQIGRIYDWLKLGGVPLVATVPHARDQVHSTFMGRPFVGSGLSQDEYLACIKQVSFEIMHHSVSSFTPKAVEAGICKAEENIEEPHLFVWAKKGSL